MELAKLLGDPVGTLPVVFHLLWSGELQTNLSRLLSADALLTRQRSDASTTTLGATACLSLTGGQVRAG
jgi:hypothetical protein